VYIFTLLIFWQKKSKRMRKEKNRPWHRPTGLRSRSQVRGSRQSTGQVRFQVSEVRGSRNSAGQVRSQVRGSQRPETWPETWQVNDSLNFIFKIFKFLVCGKFCCTLIYHSYRNNFWFSIRFVTVLNEKTFSRIIVVFVFHYLSTNLWCLVFVELSIVVSWCDDWRLVFVICSSMFLPCFYFF
jgi:hypothetical protein